ncbi:hypothetical protein GPECTOR_1g277 [Gonium pectorale]|uniref:Bifunctional inhibitor/plant lipid transfer protein/seed storage helical domain-containing protein n=1 Tax=Gonium pectorale TaxID=33097 RepID=A0A150H2Q8_GONPE|nr:hypothetical protein GPECTOR_1g277 [Gonium pectorale]|eukprot:KXZ56314.1 hypothetical protein GPECTOR_1g277 [Gonium pectorale]
MANRRTIAAGVLAALLVLALATQTAQAAKMAKCEAVRTTVPSNPSAKAFKACAAKKPITVDCCRNLLPLADLQDCLAEPGYRAEVDAWLGGATTIAEAQKACLS